MIADKVTILGREYEIRHQDYDADNDLAGWCENFRPIIMLINPDTLPNLDAEVYEIAEKQTLRHEIVHAFLNESGLSADSLQCEGGWARNEEMIDWFAIQGPKIYKAWEEAGAL